MQGILGAIGNVTLAVDTAFKYMSLSPFVDTSSGNALASVVPPAAVRVLSRARQTRLG
jgi:hypothetical protein